MVLGPQAGQKLLDSLPGCEGWLVSEVPEIVRT